MAMGARAREEGLSLASWARMVALKALREVSDGEEEAAEAEAGEEEVAGEGEEPAGGAGEEEIEEAGKESITVISKSVERRLESQGVIPDMMRLVKFYKDDPRYRTKPMGVTLKEYLEGLWVKDH